MERALKIFPYSIIAPEQEELDWMPNKNGLPNQIFDMILVWGTVITCVASILSIFYIFLK